MESPSWDSAHVEHLSQAALPRKFEIKKILGGKSMSDTMQAAGPPCRTQNMLLWRTFSQAREESGKVPRDTGPRSDWTSLTCFTIKDALRDRLISEIQTLQGHGAIQGTLHTPLCLFFSLPPSCPYENLTPADLISDPCSCQLDQTYR